MAKQHDVVALFWFKSAGKNNRRLGNSLYRRGLEFGFRVAMSKLGIQRINPFIYSGHARITAREFKLAQAASKVLLR